MPPKLLVESAKRNKVIVTATPNITNPVVSPMNNTGISIKRNAAKSFFLSFIISTKGEFEPNEAEFPKPVSNRLLEAFQNKCFTDKKKFRFRNVDENLSMYQGSQVGLSFGGGIDSSSVRKMFPEAYVVHEAHVRDGKLVPSYSHSVVNHLGEIGRLVQTNMRYLSKPGGWHSWPCSTSTSMLLATDMDFGIILTGSILGACFLSNGAKFWDRIKARAWHGPTGNYWQSAFDAIGLPMFSPVTGVSEFQTMKQSKQLLESGEVVYCMESDGFPCGLCSKCFRRDVIRRYLDEQYVPKWENYHTESIIKFLQNRPLMMGHIFSTAFSLKSNLFPDWILNEVEDLKEIKSEWAMKVYQPAFDLCAPEWREYISNRVLRFIQPMDEKEELEFKSWNQT